MIRAGALALCLALTAAAPASAALRVLIVSGLGGEPEYERRFEDQATRIATASVRAAGSPGNVVTMTGENARKPAIQKALRELAQQSAAEDQVVIVLIGHGTYDGEEYRINLPGPDMTGTELRTLFDRIPAREQLIVNATSASGAVSERWKRENRIVITATRSGTERNATRFAEYWIQALSSSEADRDKNEVVTAAEAFEFASRKVADAFKTDAALATEHARIAGGNAARFVVARLGEAPFVTDDPALNAMLTRQAGIERQLEALKGRKDTLEREKYYDELEKVLVALARLDRDIEQRRATLTGASTRGPDAGTF